MNKIILKVQIVFCFCFFMLICTYSTYGAYLLETDSKEEILRKLKAVEYGPKWDEASFDIAHMKSEASSQALRELIHKLKEVAPDGVITNRLVSSYIIKEMRAKRFDESEVLSWRNGYYKNSIIWAIKHFPLDEYALKKLNKFSLSTEDCDLFLLITEILMLDNNTQIIDKKSEIIMNILKTLPHTKNFYDTQQTWATVDHYQGWTIGGVDTVMILEKINRINGLSVDILRKMRKNASDKFTKNCIDLILALKDDKDCVNNIKEIIKDTSNDLYIRYFALTELFNKYVSEKDIPFLKLLVTDTSRVIPSEKLQKEWERVAPGLNNNRPIGASKLSLKLKKYPIRDVAQEMLLKFQ